MFELAGQKEPFKENTLPFQDILSGSNTQESLFPSPTRGDLLITVSADTDRASWAIERKKSICLLRNVFLYSRIVLKLLE